MRELGEENFTIVLDHTFPCANKVELEREEYKTLTEYMEKGLPVYNSRMEGKLSEEHKQKIGEANRHREWTQESRQKLAVSGAKRRCTDDTKAKLRESLRGKIWGRNQDSFPLAA
jgi:hypothetical protein